jgi:hypothetical protein
VERAPVRFVAHCGLPPFLNSGKALLLSLFDLLLVLLNHRLIHGPPHSISSSERNKKTVRVSGRRYAFEEPAKNSKYA